MEAMAVNFSYSMAKSLLPKLGSFLAQETLMLASVDDDLRYIIDELDSIASFLWCLSDSQLHDKNVKTWMRQIRELSYDAEDMIDEFVHRYGRPHEHGGFKGYMLLTWLQIKCLFRSHTIATDLKKLRSQADYISSRRSRYGLPAATGPSAVPMISTEYMASYDRLPGIFFEKDKLVDIEERSKKLVDWMKSDRPELDVFTIVGLGGLGKTTVAKHVYDNHMSTGIDFHCRSWITVSQSFLIEELFKQMLNDFGEAIPEKKDARDAEKLMVAIQEHLKDKRYVIVFDDLWTLTAWDTIKLALPDNGKGSRIIVTTRVKMVAKTCCSHAAQENIYNLPLLSDHHSKDLLCKRVFEAPNYACPPHLKDNFDIVLKKCGRLPLAIVTIGGILKTKPTESLHWENFIKHIGTMLDTNINLEKMKRVLTLGYNDLPFPLKPCLLYLCVFPEDYEIRRTRLVRLWLAEGFVSGRRDMPSEEVAEEYLNELISRSLVQPSKIGDDGKVKTCRVHDMMLEVIASISISENFVTVFAEHFLEVPHGKARRLSVHDQSKLEVDPDISHVRSMINFCRTEKVLDYSKLSFLRILDFEGCKSINNNDLKNISELFLLKYLGLRGASVTLLPKSIGELQNLETLDIRDTDISSLPNTIVKLEKLAYLLCGHKHLDRQGSRFAIPATKLQVPVGIRNMKNLRILGTLDSNSDALQELGDLTQLRKLVLSGKTPPSARKHLCQSIEKLSRSLRSFSFCDRSSFSIQFLDRLLPAPSCLRSLNLMGPLGKLPTWIASLGDLIKLTLVETKLQSDPLKDLQGLRNLSHLALGWQACDKDELCFSRGGFKKLKLLYLDDFSVTFEEQALENLEVLVIKKYRDQNALDIFGIKGLRSLKKVDIDIFNFQLKFSLITVVEEHHNRPALIVR